MKAKPVHKSAIETYHIVMPNHTNQLATIFGGELMSWIDIAAAMTASRHAERHVVTAEIDSISFKSPIKVGDHVHIKAWINYVGTTSMEVEVQVCKQNPLSGKSAIATSAFVTMVAVDDHGRPTPVPPLLIKTGEEKKRYEIAKKRVLERKKLKK